MGLKKAVEAVRCLMGHWVAAWLLMSTSTALWAESFISLNAVHGPVTGHFCPRGACPSLTGVAVGGGFVSKPFFPEGEVVGLRTSMGLEALVLGEGHAQQAPNVRSSLDGLGLSLHQDVVFAAFPRWSLGLEISPVWIRTHLRPGSDRVSGGFAAGIGLMYRMTEHMTLVTDYRRMPVQWSEAWSSDQMDLMSVGLRHDFY